VARGDRGVSRRMWPYAAERKFTVHATYEQSAAWGRAASIKGLPVPVFLSVAADVYAAHLDRVHSRLQRAAERRRAREAR
jgi:hypothetical protein